MDKFIKVDSNNNNSFVSKRRLPRHVDGRVMIGTMSSKAFIFMFCPFLILGIILLFLFPSPVVLALVIIILGSIFILFSENANKEINILTMIDSFKFSKKGNIYYERRCLTNGFFERSIRYSTKIKK